MFTINQEKLEAITEIINDEAQPSATTQEVEAFVLGDWSPEDEHQEWLDEADTQEIADWIIATVWS